MLDNTSQRIYAFALLKLSANDIPEKKLTEKLEEKFITKTEEENPEKIQEISDKIFEIIHLLKSQKYIDDIRYCENFIRWRKNTMPRGKYMIIQELVLKRISNELATIMCNKYISHHAEYKMCEVLFIQKIKKLEQRYFHKRNSENTKEINIIIKQKVFQFLAGKLFSYSVMNDVWDKNMVHYD